MTEQQALQQIGASVFQAISTSWKKAWDDIRGPFNHPDHGNRIRSSLLQEHASIYGRQLLPALGVNYVRDQTQHMFVLPDVACIIFKKLDEGQRAHKNDTDRCDRLFQSLLIADMPTLVAGMEPSWNWLSFNGVFVCRPNFNGVGNAWALDITDDAVAVDADQSKLISIFEETKFDEAPKKTKQKWKPKYDTNIGESSEAAGSGGKDGE